MVLKEIPFLADLSTSQYACHYTCIWVCHILVCVLGYLLRVTVYMATFFVYLFSRYSTV